MKEWPPDVNEIIAYVRWYNSSECISEYEDAVDNYDIDLSNNSWALLYYCGELLGNETPGVYDDNSAVEDRVVRGECGKRIPVVFAAGNNAERGDHGCPKKWNTLSRNAVAKNVLTVGATDDGSTPVYASFSSRGPTADGRLKPDVVAPGCDGTCSEGYGSSSPSEWIWSTWPSDTYSGMGGTSCATPVVSGVVALMLEHWWDELSGTPWPSTIKAILIQTAEDVTTGGDCQTGPDYSTGYGLINAKDAIDLISDAATDDLIIEGSIGEQNDRDFYSVSLSQGQTFRITLAWDDHEGTENADPALVNDLDLIVRCPDGETWFPWTFPSDPCNAALPSDSNNAEADHLNNVEQVYVSSVPSASAGTWTIEVSGYEVPEPCQPYSLVTDTYELTTQTAPWRFYIRDANDNCVAWFDEDGNLALKGELSDNDTPTPSGSDEFIFKDSMDDEVAIVDMSTGDMVIAGDYEEDTEETPSGDDFEIRDSSNNMVAFIDEDGSLYLTGKLYQNSNP
jgi:hypothetical protein